MRPNGYDFHAWTDSALYLRRQRDHLVLTIEQRTAPAPDPITLSLVAEHDCARLEVVDSEDDTDRGVDLSERILAALNQLGGAATREALRAVLRVRNERLGPEFARLVATGVLTRTSACWTRPAAVPVPPSQEEAERNAPPHRPSV